MHATRDFEILVAPIVDSTTIPDDLMDFCCYFCIENTVMTSPRVALRHLSRRQRVGVLSRWRVCCRQQQHPLVCSMNEAHRLITKDQNMHNELHRQKQKYAQRDDNRQRLLKSLSILDNRLRRSVEAEAEATRAQFESLYARRDTKELIREGVLLVDMVAKQSGRLYGDLLFRFELSDGGKLPLHKFRPGVTIRIRNAKTNTPAEGTVSEVSPHYMLVTISPSFSDIILDSPRSNAFRIEMWMQDATTRRQLAALDELLNVGLKRTVGAQSIRAILLESPIAPNLAARSPRWMKSRKTREYCASLIKDLDQLNDSQRGAIGAALDRTMSLWQGPPGTGKTKTLLAFLNIISKLSMVENDIGQIMAVGDTNAAADNLLAGMLANGIKVTRIGQPAKVRPELRHACLDALAEASPSGIRAATLRDQATGILERAELLLESGNISLREYRELRKDSQKLWVAADDQLRMAIQNILEESTVIIGTCAAAGDSRLLDFTFRVVVIDEATQATEPSTMIPLMKGAECVVMAGDHKQLPPLVLSKEGLANHLDVPLFRRLQEKGMPALLLDTQYRMHPRIAAFASEHFYDGCIKCGVEAKSRKPPSGFPWPDIDIPIAFIDCHGSEEQYQKQSNALVSSTIENGTYLNREQAKLSIFVLKNVLKYDSEVTVALLTPYNGQVRLFNEILKSDSELADAVNAERLVWSTIDGFQGREADVVVLSTVRSNSTRRLGFLQDMRRMNVALTRARNGLVVIGSASTLSADPNWNIWLEMHAPLQIPGKEFAGNPKI